MEEEEGANVSVSAYLWLCLSVFLMEDEEVTLLSLYVCVSNGGGVGQCLCLKRGVTI